MAEEKTKWLDINVSAATYDALKLLGRQAGMSVSGTAKALVLGALLRKASLAPSSGQSDLLDGPTLRANDVDEAPKHVGDDERWKAMVERFGGPNSDMLPAARHVKTEASGKTTRIYHADDFPWEQMEAPYNVKPKQLAQLTIRS